MLFRSITFQGATIETRDVVQFLSPNGGLIYQGVSAITTTLRLQKSAERFATNEIPSGYLKQTGGETMTAQDLADMAAAFAQARQNSTVAALNHRRSAAPFAHGHGPSRDRMVVDGGTGPPRVRDACSAERRAAPGARPRGRHPPRRDPDRKSTRLNSSHVSESRMPSSA